MELNSSQQGIASCQAPHQRLNLKNSVIQDKANTVSRAFFKSRHTALGATPLRRQQAWTRPVP